VLVLTKAIVTLITQSQATPVVQRLFFASQPSMFYKMRLDDAWTRGDLIDKMQAGI
jgi:hypothetical protein